MTPQQEPEHCGHYEVCHIVHTRKDHVCPSDPNNKTCDYDTRSRPHTPAPEPDEKCEVCGNPLEYHNNAYRWCKNMHSFRYFQNPHTTAPECDCDCLSCNPDMYISCERRINPDRPRYTVEQIADIDKQIRKAAKVARGQVLDKIMWYMANHGVEKRPEGYYVVSGTFSLGGFIKHMESLRSQKEPQQ